MKPIMPPVKPTLLAYDLIGYAHSPWNVGDPVYCLECDCGVDEDGLARHPIFVGDFDRPDKCSGCGKQFPKWVEP